MKYSFEQRRKITFYLGFAKIVEEANIFSRQF